MTLLRIVSILVLSTALATSACGRKGDPIPPHHKQEQKKTY